MEAERSCHLVTYLVLLYRSQRLSLEPIFFSRRFLCIRLKSVLDGPSAFNFIGDLAVGTAPTEPGAGAVADS